MSARKLGIRGVFPERAQLFEIGLIGRFHIARANIPVAVARGAFYRRAGKAANPDRRSRLLDGTRRQTGVFDLKIFPFEGDGLAFPQPTKDFQSFVGAPTDLYVPITTYGALNHRQDEEWRTSHAWQILHILARLAPGRSVDFTATGNPNRNLTNGGQCTVERVEARPSGS